MNLQPGVRGVARRLSDPRVILVAGWLGLVLYAFPGLMTMDSIQQLQEARSHVFTDSHPALMAIVWSGLDRIIAGPFLMLVLQSVPFVAGLYLLLRRALSPRKAAVAAVLILWFPPVLAPMAVIWKDCMMAGFFLLGTAALLDDRRKVQIAGLVCFVIATSVRYNALAATLPLIVLLFRSFSHWLKRYATALGVWLTVTLVAFGLNAAVTDKKMHIWESSLALMDIAGTLAETDGTIPDDQLRTTLAGTQILVDKDIHAAIRRQYSALDFEPLIAREGHLWDVPISGTVPAPAPQVAAIARAFWDVVTAHPAAYLRHRWHVFENVIALAPGPVQSPVMTHRYQYEDLLKMLGLRKSPSHFQDWLGRRLVRIARTTPLFRPWMYLVIALLLLPLALRHRDVLALLLSGIGLEASLFVLAPTPDYRYSHWLVLCTCVAVVMLTARRGAASRPPP